MMLVKYFMKSQKFHIKSLGKKHIYNRGHNIFELYNVLLQVQFAVSKTKLVI